MVLPTSKFSTVEVIDKSIPSTLTYTVFPFAVVIDNWDVPTFNILTVIFVGESIV